jgi:hypothetical protein
LTVVRGVSPLMSLIFARVTFSEYDEGIFLDITRAGIESELE